MVGGVEIEMAPNDFDIRLRENIRRCSRKAGLRDGTPAFGIATQILSQGFHSRRGSNASLILRSWPPNFANMVSRWDRSGRANQADGRLSVNERVILVVGGLRCPVVRFETLRKSHETGILI